MRSKGLFAWEERGGEKGGGGEGRERKWRGKGVTHAQVLHQDKPLAYCIAEHFCGRKFHDFADKISSKFSLVHLGEAFHEVKICQVH